MTKGLMSPEEFHRRKADLMETLASGLDDGTTRTPSKEPADTSRARLPALLQAPVSCVCVCACRRGQVAVGLLPGRERRRRPGVAERGRRPLLLLGGGPGVGVWLQELPDASLRSAQNRGVRLRPAG